MFEWLKGLFGKELGKYEALSDPYKPSKIKYLILQESPTTTPVGEEDRFIYNPASKKQQRLLSSLAFTFLNKKFTKKSDKKSILDSLKKKGVYVINAVNRPIHTDRLRDEVIRAHYRDLKKRIDQLDPDKILVAHSSLKKNILDKLEQDFDNVHYVGYPRYYHDKNFRKKVKKHL